MNLLIDTHVWLWLASGAPYISPAALGAVREAAAASTLYLSQISMWEIALKASRERIELDRPLRQWMHKALDFPGLLIAPISADVAIGSAELPSGFHGDPADRIIAATARVEGLTLVTHDKKLLQLSKRGFLKALPT